eukprot:1045106_1
MAHRFNRLLSRFRNRHRVRMLYPVSLAVTIPFMSVRDSQGQVCSVEISGVSAAIIGGISACGIIASGYLFSDVYNSSKMQEMELNLKGDWEAYSQERRPTAYKVGNVVYLQGSAKHKDGAKGASLIGTLPKGWRPTHRVSFCPTAQQYAQFGLIDVFPNGEIRLTGNPQPNRWISLDGLDFVVNTL